MRTFYDYVKILAEKEGIQIGIEQNLVNKEDKVVAILKILLGSCERNSLSCRLALSAYR